MADRLEQTGSSDELSQILGLYGDDEAGDLQPKSSPEDEIETASTQSVDSTCLESSFLETQSLASQYPQREVDVVSQQSSDRNPRSAPAALAYSPDSSAPTSEPVDPAVLFRRLWDLSLETYFPSSHLSSFLSSLPPSSQLSRELAFYTTSSGPDIIPFDQQFEMYHFPLPIDAVFQYQMQMATYHQRQLDEVLAPAECPIGSDAETCFRARHAVILIENLPFAITRQEAIQFFGTKARLAEGWPVHIIMERSSGKTMDCYVEFATDADAEDALRRIKALHDANQGPRMGNRYVDVSISSQAALMKALFPLAKCINWETGRPVVVLDESWPNGFAGFLTDEELFCATRHAREPGRSAYANKVPQRPYESIISTIWKFPWYATHLYTVHNRNKIFFALKEMMVHLVERLSVGQIVGLDTRLVNELLRAGLECPAFNPRMKYTIAEISKVQAVFSRMHQDWLAWFPFDTLTWLRPNNPIALEFYATLISNGRVVRIPRGLSRDFFDPKYAQPYGDWWFAWVEPVASEKIFSDAINDEKQVLQTLLTTGHQAMNPVRHALSVAPFNFPRSVTSPMALLELEQQGRAHWPSQGPNPYVVAAPIPAATPAPAPASPRAPLPAPVARRPPTPRGPQSPRSRGNWRGASSRGHRRF